MQWHDKGIILSMRRHGEKALILNLFTENHGRHSGVIKPSRKNQGDYEIGTYVRCQWHARLEQHLGYWALERVSSPLAAIINDSEALCALTASTSLLDVLMPLNESHEQLFSAFLKLHLGFKERNWHGAYIEFERALLEAAGFKLDLKHCAATGQQDDLAYVSPKSGRAVSFEAGKPYEKKLLRLPVYFLKSKTVQNALSTLEFVEALELIEYFLERYALEIHGLKMPMARQRLKKVLAERVEHQRLA